MKTLRLGLWWALLMVSALASTSAANELESFFASRQVMGTVYFARNSVALDEQGEAQVLALVPRLRNLDPAKKLVRIEGFSTASEAGEDGVTRAMLRAYAVNDMLRARGAGAERFSINGQVVGARAGQDSSAHRAEIVVYDNLLDIHPVEIDPIIQR
ncbi:hypothetical protein [Geoalkalibacter sp.]|uniref:hypothetical protein n=1 Tax=Geoalkalibacter sp. TaxID=3041440 RepID=UPI00272EAA38|nr:hypothetical protein [Geoalkalibacter sp.]